MIFNRIFLLYNRFCNVFGILHLKMIFNKMRGADSDINLSGKAVCTFNFQVSIPGDNLHIELKWAE